LDELAVSFGRSLGGQGNDEELLAFEGGDEGFFVVGVVDLDGFDSFGELACATRAD
jgi:hypothetical protein